MRQEIDVVTGEVTELPDLPPPVLSLADLKAAKRDAANRLRDQHLAAGALHPSSGLHIALGDGSRADIGGMATTAVAVIATGAVPWPEAYALGWISIENTRIPLATPADGIALAALVGQVYSAIVQHGRNLKDAIEAAADETELAAIDVNAGWPT